MKRYMITGFFLFLCLLAVVPPAMAAPVPECPFRHNAVLRGKASWYGPGFHGRKTASGEVFNMNSMTAAHPSLKLGTRIMVENMENGQVAVLRVNDRGPYVGKRVLDVSRRAAEVLGFRDEGLTQVTIRICS